MVYLLDPAYWDGTSFLLAEYHGNSAKAPYLIENKPIPAHLFSKSLTVAGAMQRLPDIFHTSRGTIVFSERARAVVEELAPGQVEFVPVTINAAPELADRLNLANAYYFINVLGRAQRLQWLEIPTQISKPKEDGTQVAILLPDRRNWKLRERAEGEPLIWRESDWRAGNRDYRDRNVFVEDVLWQELNATFPDQLNAQRVGK
jgi:hypothetical protein